MPDQPTFVVNDRRKFTADGELRPDLPPREDRQPADNAPRPQLLAEPTPQQAPSASLSKLADLPEADALGPLATSGATENAQATGDPEMDDVSSDDSLPPGPTAEQAADAARAYQATSERLEIAMRAANPGGEHMPPMTFDRLVQSLYTQALILLGGGAQPGETPRVDILGAKETIDMLAIMADKANGNLDPNEDRLLQSALFDLRMGFLEITQALARQAAQRGSAPGGPPSLGGAGGPRIVR